MEQHLQQLMMNKSELDDENNSLHQVLAVKDKLLQAQADQIAALQAELENQLQLSHHQSECGAATEPACRHDSTIHDLSTESLVEPAPDMPSLFDELQQLIVRLTRKVEHSTRALEAVQCGKTNASCLISPRSQMTPSTSTEDVSVK